MEKCFEPKRNSTKKKKNALLDERNIIIWAAPSPLSRETVPCERLKWVVVQAPQGSKIIGLKQKWPSW